MKRLSTKVMLGGIIIIVIAAVFLFYEVHSQGHNSDTSTLKLVSILHRHGLRTPERTFKNDEYQESVWPIPFGQLLKKGTQQLYKLGLTLKERYKPFINEYSSKTVRVRTSDYDRCHTSAAALLSAWFPPSNKEQLWNDKLDWHPIPIHTVPTKNDNILAQEKHCPKFTQEKTKILKMIKANETSEDKELFDYLTAHMGQNISTLKDIEVFYASLLIEDLNGFTLPEWAKKVFPDEMRNKAMISMYTNQWNTLLKRLSTGPLLNELFNNFNDKINNRNADIKLMMYSAHDTTLAGVWYGLGFKDLIFPDFGSSFIFELHEMKGEFFVKMFYFKNTETTEPEELIIPNCSSSGPCPFNLLLNITDSIRPADWDQECYLNTF